jgi:hypothetical protein
MGTQTLPAPAIGVTYDQLAAHLADKARRQREADELCPIEERLKLTKPKYAKECEDRKPVYKWKVEFNVIDRKSKASPKDKYADDEEVEDDDTISYRAVTKFIEAQNEKDAWALVCDRMQDWPSPKLAKPKFTRLEQTNGPTTKPKGRKS